jgi:IclR family transcriptional regulator, pca regulon regulatory protein
MAIADRDIMGGLAKGLTVIETFSAERPRQSIAEVALASGLDRATARRCLLTLAKQGYADYDGKFFTLTPRVLRLGTACLATMPLPQLVQPSLDRISDAMGESSSVSILDGSEIVYIARAAQKKVMSITLMPGSRLPAYCTSMGRVMLAALPEAEAIAILTAAPLTMRTPFTVTSVPVLLDELTRVRAQGYAMIDQEVELGLRSIAVPLINARGRVVAALNFGFSAGTDMPEAAVTRHLSLMQEVKIDLRRVLR